MLPARRVWQPSHPKPKDMDKTHAMGLLSRSWGDSGDTSRTASPTVAARPVTTALQRGRFRPL